MLYNSLSILVIEDNTGDYFLVREYLQDAFENATILHADTLQQGVEVLEKEAVNVILLDLTLPDGIGIDSFHTVYAKAPQIPIIILTGLGDTATALESLQVGAQDYIVKDDSNSTVLSKSIRYAIERSKILDHLKKSEEQYKYLFLTNPIPMCAFAKADKRFLMVNDAAIAHYGYSEEEFLQMNVEDLNAGNGVIKHTDPSAPNIDNSNTTDLKHRKKDGSIIDIEMRKHDIIIEGTEASLAVLHDVTERNNAKEQLEQNNSDLRQFSYITSHNLRAPLSNLLGIINLLDTSTISDPTTLLLLKNFEECTHQLNDTVKDLLDVLIIKNSENTQKEPLDLRKVFERIVTSVQTTIDKSHMKIDVNFDEAYNVVFNRTYLDSILLNLLTNAIKYSSPKRTPEIKVYTKKIDEGTRLYFSDNGLGIDLTRYRDRVFGLYQRFHNHADSKGLGLYMVNSQVRVMGGEIEIESEVDKGTTFIITFKN